MVLPGTVTIRPEVLSELTYDIIESSEVPHGLNKIILINGHRIVNVVWIADLRTESSEQAWLHRQDF